MKMGRKKRSANIPDDIVVEILTRLPAKSLLRFKSACKKWCSVVQEPEFVALHHKRSYHRLNGGCLIISLSDRRLLFSVGYEGGHASLLLEFNHYIALKPASGLILLVPTYDTTQDPVFVYNPSIRKLVSLPPPSNDLDDKIEELREQDPYVRFRASYFLGFDQSSTTGQYKVLCILTVFRDYKENEYYPYVLTLGTESWRKIDNIFQRLGEVVQCVHSCCVNGAIHWRVANYRDPGSIIAFDVGKEKFLMIPPPDKPLNDFYQLMIVGGYLALSNSSEVWVLEDYPKGEWTQFKLKRTPLEWHQEGEGDWAEVKLKQPPFERIPGRGFSVYQGAIHSGEKFFEALQSQSQCATELLWVYYFDKSVNEGSLSKVTGLRYPNSTVEGCSCSSYKSTLDVSSNVETLFSPSRSGII